VSWTTIAAIYFIVWWLVLFTVLPWGARSQHEAGEVVPGTDPGAPAIPGLRKKVVWTTVIATVVFGAFYLAFVTRAIDFENLVTLWGLLKPTASQ
jgi:predicted secreted protein